MEKPVNTGNIDRQILSAFADVSDAAFDPEGGLSRLRQAQSARRLRRRRHAWIAGGAIAAFAVLGTAPQTRAFAVRCVDACVAEGDRLGQIVFTSVRPGQSKHGQAPDFALPDAHGKTVRLSDFRGKVVVLNFWATWCPPCREEIPWFVEFQQRYAHKDLTVVGVALDEDGWRSVTPFVKDHGVNYPMVLGHEDMLASFGNVETLPTTWIIGRDGRVLATHAGLAPRDVYESEIAAALNESK